MQEPVSCLNRNNKSLQPLKLKTQRFSGESVQMLLAENAVIVVGMKGCCMCHVVKMLLLGLGVNPAVLEIDEDMEKEVIGVLEGDGGRQTVKLPAVYIGGKLFGGLDRVMSTHITGELVPILKEAGALWL